MPRAIWHRCQSSCSWSRAVTAQPPLFTDFGDPPLPAYSRQKCAYFLCTFDFFQLKVIAIDEQLRVIYEDNIHFDKDLPEFGYVFEFYSVSARVGNLSEVVC
uniref:Uncharacterized protein n=1 Tax=Terrapene triunguis TaxID=2587831 RepID=A0A674J1H9_9SAUR